MLNIFTQVCGLAIIILLIYFCARHRLVGLWREYLFVQILAVTALSLCVDILSIFAINYESVFSPPVTSFICRFYVIILVAEVMYAVLYTASIIFNRKTYFRFLRIICTVNLLYIILAFVLPIGYYTDGFVTFSYGTVVNLAYLLVGIYIILCIALTFVPSVDLSKLQRRAIRAWIFSWIVAACIQFIFPQILLTGFASAFGVLVIFCALENPDSRLDRNTGAFNEGTCREYVKSRFVFNKPYSMLAIVLEQSKHAELNSTQHDLATLSFADFFLNLGKYRVFCDSENDFQILFEKKEDLDFVFKQIRARFEDEWKLDGTGNGIIFEPKYIVLEDSTVLNDARDHFFVMHQMMHHFPSTGVDTVYIDENTVKELNEFELVKQEIQLALDEDRVEPFFQPIYSLKEEKFTAAEGLARIRTKEGGLMPPGLFIPVAEETGLVKKIDERIFEKSCQLLTSQKLTESGMHYIELNVSVSQCEDPKLYSRYIDLIDKYGVNPGHINLEVTESASIRQKNTLLNNIDKLREKGVKFSLDDFGTGQSNLDYIVSMPVDIIKFDMTMTRSYFENEKTKIVMRNTVNMIDEMGLLVVIEGVETVEQFDELCKLPIDYIQGYVFSKPLPTGEFIDFIKEKNSSI